MIEHAFSPSESSPRLIIESHCRVRLYKDLRTFVDDIRIVPTSGFSPGFRGIPRMESGIENLASIAAFLVGYFKSQYFDYFPTNDLVLTIVALSWLPRDVEAKLELSHFRPWLTSHSMTRCLVVMHH